MGYEQFVTVKVLPEIYDDHIVAVVGLGTKKTALRYKRL